MALTNADVKAAKATDRNYKLADSRGLFLFVATSGSKTWRFKYYHGRKERSMTIGRYPDVGLADARELHEDARRLLRSGKDPAREGQRQKQALIAAVEATFKKIGEIWLEEQTPGWSPANAKRVRHRLENDIYPVFGSVPIHEIDGALVLRALRTIEKRGSIETAKRVRGYVRAILKRAKGERLVGNEALLEVDEIADALLPAKRGRRLPALTTVGPLTEFQHCVDRSTASAVTKLASRLLALTAVRVGVLRAATWDEFEGIDWARPDEACVRPVWRISAARMKLSVEDKSNDAFGHDVPLSVQALEILRALRPITGYCPFLFPNSRGWRSGPMTDAALSTVYKRMAAGRYKGRMVPHGWRTAFSTVMNERAAELERDGDRMIIDMVLAHVPEGTSASEWAYNRARYFKPREKLLQTWADIVTVGLRSPFDFTVSAADN
jgi:integrase